MGGKAEFDPADRELCPDGACVGLVGPSGRCKECGAISPTTTQHSRNRGMRTADEVQELEDEPDDEPGDEPDDEQSRAAMEPAPDDFDDRVLCDDEGCIGVVGVDGTCRECGTVAVP